MAQTRTEHPYETNAPKDAVNDLKDRAAEGLDRVTQQAEQMARSVSEQARGATDNVQYVAQNFRSALDKSIREQPLTTVALTAAVAFVIGAIWKR